MSLDDNDDIRVFVSCATKYNFYVASISMTSQRVGEVRIPTGQILAQLKAEERRPGGWWYTTPLLEFCLVYDGICTGRVHMSFESKTPPPLPTLRLGKCGCSNEQCHARDEFFALLH